MLGGHVQVTSSGLGEVTPQLDAGKIRILAVLSDERLPGKLADIPTAKEQGYDISWPVIRGFYMGPEVSDEDFNWWKSQFDSLLADEDFAKLREQRDLFPLSMTGDELKAFVEKQVQDYKALAGEFGGRNAKARARGRGGPGNCRVAAPGIPSCTYVSSPRRGCSPAPASPCSPGASSALRLRPGRAARLSAAAAVPDGLRRGVAAVQAARRADASVRSCQGAAGRALRAGAAGLCPAVRNPRLRHQHCPGRFRPRPAVQRSPVASVISGVLLGVLLYGLFDYLLDVPLPLGLLRLLES